MLVTQSTRNKVEALAIAVIQDSEPVKLASHPRWVVLKTSDPSADPDDRSYAGMFLVGEQARLYQEALQALEDEEAVEHLTRAALDEALFALVWEFDPARFRKQARSVIREKVSDFVSNLTVPPTHFEVAYSIDNIDLRGVSLTIGDVVFREFTPCLAEQWGFDNVGDLLRKEANRIVGQPVGIVACRGRTAQKAAERALGSFERALNTLRVAAGSFPRRRILDRQLLQSRGQLRVIRETSPQARLISTGGGAITDPLDLELASELLNSTNDFVNKLAPLYNGVAQVHFRDALLRCVDRIGVSITRQNSRSLYGFGGSVNYER